MDINTRLDGFIVHPLDAFNDKHHEDNIPKFSNTAPHLDGFQRHPLDSFIIHEHDNSLSTDNIFSNYQDTNQFNNLDLYSNNQTYNIGNISSQYNHNNTTNDLGLNLDLMSSTPSYNNDIDINKIFSGNNNTYETPTSYNYNTSINTNYNYIGSSTPVTTNYSNYINNYTTQSTQYSPNTTNYTRTLPTIYKNAITQNVPNYNAIPITTNTTITKPTIYAPKKNIVSYSLSVPKIRRVYTLPTSKISSIGYNFSRYPSSTVYNRIGSYATRNISYNPLHKTTPYSVTTYEPEINLKYTVPRRRTVIIPRTRSVIVPRKTRVIIPKRQTIIVPKPILIPQKNVVVPTVQVSTSQSIVPQVIPNTSSYKTLPGNVLVPTIPIVNNTLNVSNVPSVIANPVERVPMDNMRVIERKIISAPVMTSKIYVPRKK